jgi:outer membrane receptor protein involved in Fe transport
MSSRAALAAFFTAALYAPVLLADGAGDLESLLSETVVTTASTTAQRASTAPATSVTLTAEDLRIYGIRSLDEAINFLSLGIITSDPLRTPDIGARGVLLPDDNGKHFLLLVNGHALNDPLYGAARFDQGSGIPIEIIDHIEVIVGPGSVLYGSNAMMGVINVITKGGANYRGGHVIGEYEIERSVRTGAGAGLTFEAFGERGEVLTHAEYFYAFGPDLDFELQPFVRDFGTAAPVNYGPNAPVLGRWGGTVEQAYFTKASSGVMRLRVGDLELNLLGSAYERGIPYSTASLGVDFDDPDSRELDRAVRFDLKHEAVLTTLVQLTSRVYGDYFDYQRRANRVSIFGCLESEAEICQFYNAGRAHWLGSELRLALNWFEDSSFVTTFGVDARMRWVGAKEEVLDAATLRPIQPTAGLIDDSAGVLSPYLQQSWSPTSWLDLNAGVRLDADERFDPIASPRAAVALEPLPSTVFKAIYSQAFRAPSWSETHSTGRRGVASRDLEAEIVRSAELSVEQRFGQQRLMFGVFRTWWDNLVEPHVLSLAEIEELQRRGELPFTTVAGTQFQNVAELENYGWNGAWSGALAEGRLRYGLNATAAYTRRQVGAVAVPLEVSPQLFGNARVAYVMPGALPTPAIAAYYVHERPVDRAYSGAFVPIAYAPPLLELRGTLSGNIPPVSGLSYRLGVSYATASEGPYVVGARQSRGTVDLPPALSPIDEFKVFVGLRYDFFTGADETTDGGVL